MNKWVVIALAVLIIALLTAQTGCQDIECLIFGCV